MARKSTKYLELSAYGLNYDCKNLFDEEYGDNKRTESMIYEEINALQSNNIYESLKLGRNLLELLNNDIHCVNFDRTLKRLNIHIGRTQAIKYIECFNCFNERFQNEKSTEQLENLGIEKTYLLTTLKKRKLKDKLVAFIFSKNLTVKVLSQLIKILNDESEIFNLLQEFYRTLDENEISPDTLNPF